MRLLREIVGTGSGWNGVGNAFLFFIRNFRVQGIREGDGGVRSEMECRGSEKTGLSMVRTVRILLLPVGKRRESCLCAV